jgi:hypothetical protein
VGIKSEVGSNKGKDGCGGPIGVKDSCNMSSIIDNKEVVV